MIPPLVSFVTWNRLGLTAKNLKALLETDEDFELCIIDNNSQDDTWQYLETVSDDRIKLKTRFKNNMGPVYASNFALSKRKEDQFFFTIDNDVQILEPGWISKFLRAFEVFPELGLLGAVRPEYYGRCRLTAVEKQEGGLKCLVIKKGFVEGCCQCLRPEVLNSLGYWCEENCMGDMELCYRILRFTPYKIAYFPSVEIRQEQFISCEHCTAVNSCRLYIQPSNETCFQKHSRRYANPQFRNKFYWKYEKCLKEMENGSRSPFCASVHDEESMKKSLYNRHLAEENFSFFADNDKQKID